MKPAGRRIKGSIGEREVVAILDGATIRGRTLTARRVPGYPEYEIYPNGRVRRVAGGPGAKVGRILRANTNARGYPMLFLCSKGKPKPFEVHRLVALTFLGPPPTFWHEVAHNDGNKTNNTVENLRWATHIENKADQRRHGTHWEGERLPQAKLTEVAVKEIRHRCSTGENQGALAVEYGVSQSLISMVHLRSIWKHVA